MKHGQPRLLAQRIRLTKTSQNLSIFDTAACDFIFQEKLPACGPLALLIPKRTLPKSVLESKVAQMRTACCFLLGY